MIYLILKTMFTLKNTDNNNIKNNSNSGVVVVDKSKCETLLFVSTDLIFALFKRAKICTGGFKCRAAIAKLNASDNLVV